MFVSRRDRSTTRDRSMSESFSKNRAGKSTSKSKRSFREHSFSKRPADLDLSSSKFHPPPSKGPDATALNSTIVTISVGTPPRLFAAHYDVLTTSPFFQSYLRSQYYNSDSRQLRLPDEVPEIFSCVLEFLYKGEYSPKILYDQKRGQWTLESIPSSPGQSDSTVWIPTAAPASPVPGTPQLSASSVGAHILKDTAIYCAAERYNLPTLKRLALRKQGLQSGIPVTTILASARYAYSNTPDSDSKLRAHYLALIIRSRNTFKKSGTMQLEMGMGPAPGSPRSTGLWFDLFVAMCNHLDDMEQIVKSPR